jgi:NAD+ kinase
VDAGQCIDLRARPGGACVVRLGQTTFYQRARRKLRITDSAEIPAPLLGTGHGEHPDGS